MKTIFLLTTFVFLSPTISRASEPRENPCSPILLACEDKGYVDDEVADPGQKIWADCADVIINKNQTVRGLNIDPLRVKLCRKFKQSHQASMQDSRVWANRMPYRMPIDKD